MLSLLLMLLGGCHSDKADTAETGPKGFPSTFFWGTATAGFQVEPGCPGLPEEECAVPPSDWSQWVTDPDLVADPDLYLSGEPLSNGPGMMEFYAQDLARAADELHNNAIRVSLEWPRLFPDRAAEKASTGQELAAYADPAAVAFYHSLVDTARAEGLEPLVTLHHYTLPLWLHDGKACHEDIDKCVDRGWLDPDRIRRDIALYAAFCGQEYGADVDWWMTLNEPVVVALSGYVQPSPDRTNPPGVVEPQYGLDAAFTMARAHVDMYDALHAADTTDADGDGLAARVGLADHLVAVRPQDPDDESDVRGAEHADQLYNHAFLDATVWGCVDTSLDGACDEERTDGRKTLDFLGVNYYNVLTVMGLEKPLFGYEMLDFYPVETGVDYPEGLPEVVAIGRDYDLPVIISENGAANTDESTADTFLVPHLEGLLQAMEEGSEILGYCWWSLMDNYEWNHGMDAYRFGLYAVDPVTKARSIRPVGEAYGAIAADNGAGIGE